MDAIDNSGRLQRRFLAAGVFNTVFAYVAFAIVLAILPETVHYLIVLGLSFLISVTNAFFVQKRFVFRTVGGHVEEYFRFVFVNLNALALNALVLAGLVAIDFGVLVAQAIATALTLVLTYVGHRKFTFRM